MFDAGVFGVLSMFVAIFSAIKVFTWVLDAATRARSSFNTPLLYFFAFLFLFVFGGMTGVAVATQSLDVHWHDTYFVVAHFHFIMVGGTLTAFLAALHYWFPKMIGRMYSERMGLRRAALVFVGFFLTFFPQFLLGNAGMPRRYYNYPPQFQWLHVLSTVGAWILGAGACSSRSCYLARRALLRASARATTRGTRAASSGARRRRRRSTTSPRRPSSTLGPYDYTAPAERATPMRARQADRRRALRGPRRSRRTPRASGCGSSSASEVLLFAGLFALYAAYRAEYPVDFGDGVAHNTQSLGSVNTGVLLVSSFTVALGRARAPRGRSRGARAALVGVDASLLGLRVPRASRRSSTREHFREGIYPGGVGRVLPDARRARASTMFFTLYFCMTGLHALHVHRRASASSRSCSLEVAARPASRRRRRTRSSSARIYWHLVDVIWIFLWPLFYLIPGSHP